MTCVQNLQALMELLTVPAIALLGVYIATRQWLTARDRVRLDLFDKRLAAYERLRQAVTPVAATGKVTNVDSANFASAMSDMRFLFDTGMEAFVASIHQAMLEKHAVEQALETQIGRSSSLGPTSGSIQELDRLSSKDEALFKQITDGIYVEMPKRMEHFMRIKV